MAKPRKAAVESLALPPDVDEASYKAAVDLDKLFERGTFSRRTFEQKILSHHTKLFGQIMGQIGAALPAFDLAWPSWLYIPGQADYKQHWPFPPPDDHRYLYEWTPPTSPAGYNKASRDEGTLYAHQRILSNESYAQAEAGLGVRYTPSATLSEITLEPWVSISGEHRWYHEFEFPVAGYTWVKMRAILAAWQEIPGGWDLLAAHHREVHNAGPNSGLGHGGIIPYGLGFAGPSLGKPFLVQKGHTYLLGVVARVSVWSTLTDDRGRKLPLLEDGSFRVWGNVGFYLPKIEVHTSRVYIA